MCRNSSTLSSELSKITAPAASEVTSLFCPKAIPTVAAVSAGASLIPSPRKTVFALRIPADDLQFLLRGLAGMHLRDPDLFRQVANFRLPVPETSSTRSNRCFGANGG